MDPLLWNRWAKHRIDQTPRDTKLQLNLPSRGLKSLVTKLCAHNLSLIIFTLNVNQFLQNTDTKLSSAEAVVESRDHF